MKLPAGYGCETTNEDDTSANSNGNGTQEGDDCVNGVLRPASQSQQYRNLPVAVAVPVTGISSSASSPDRVRSGSAPRRGKTAHNFSFRSLIGSKFIRLADYAGKPILIVNVASHCNSTTKAYVQLNDLAKRFPELVIIGCPCNQFGHQENLNGEEIYQSLRHIRPGKGFEPAFMLTEKVEVNGANAHALFNFLRITLPYPCDRTLLDEMSTPSGVFSHPMRLIWMPVTRADVSWNFEKFLISPDGTPYKRYSPKLDFTSMIEDVKFLLKADVSNEKRL
ncbi:Glutathione peroxidase 1 [Phytophthora citrophthora]|uniref:Glutathione peroxidase n=1 Tax=Phytophthora citrophthora TaxID=4793 RepID=A0AAD9LCM5_9STRA|nr:Glutathione peroxidase 1 [Phytophthora citrophthora]